MYLITGCAGFIGYHMTHYLIKKKIKVIGIDSLNKYYSKELKLKRLNILKKNKFFKFYEVNLCNKNKVKKIFKSFTKIKIIHLAAQPGVIYSYKNPKSYYSNNVEATRNLVHLCKNIDIDQFLLISSSSVYGDQKKYPILENTKLKPINYYAKTKIECEKIIKNNYKNLPISTKILRPFTVYGPYGRPDMLILKFLSYMKKNKKINIYNYGKYLRDFTYIDDVIKIMFLLSKKKNLKMETYNICASRPIEINTILKLFKKNLNKSFHIKYLPKRKGEMLVTYGSNKKLLKSIKNIKFTKIEIGLKKTINWYKNFKNKKSLFLHK